MKGKLFKIALLIILIFIGVIFIKNMRIESKEIVISEIKNTHTISEEGNQRAHYLISNPPDDYEMLKKEIDKFFIQYGNAFKGAKGSSRIYFYRESNRLTKDWTPTIDFAEEEMKEHKEDIIATIMWKGNNDLEKKYYFTKRSTEKVNYGVILESVTYYGDKLVEKEIYHEDSNQSVDY